MNLEMNQTCPYCGYEEEDYCANWEEEAEKVECSHCDKTYSARAVYKFLGFETQKICEECGEIEEECYCELAVMDDD